MNVKKSLNLSIKTAKCIIFLVLAICILTGGNGQAATYIKYECVRENSREDCSSSGKIEYIYIYDQIDDQTATTIEEVNRSIPVNKTFPIIYLNSGGGSIAASIGIGRLLHLRKATVESLDVFHPSNQAICNSACALIAQGAKTRNLTEVGFHRGHLTTRIKGDRYDIAPMNDKKMQVVYDYLAEMGAPPELKAMIAATPFDQMKEVWLNLEDPFRDQEIVKIGFRMREPDGDERKRLKKLTSIRDDGDASLEEAANLGDDIAAMTLGYRLVHGPEGHEKNVDKGIHLLEKAASLNNAYAMHELGVIYRDGDEGVPRTPPKAFKYFLAAAQTGLAASQNNVGWMYYKGAGVTRSLSDAIYWITRAVEGGEAFAYGSLGSIMLEGNGFQPNDIETYKYIKLATQTMPEGRSRSDEITRLNKLKARMPPDKITKGDQYVVDWKPLRGMTSSMRDKDDK